MFAPTSTRNGLLDGGLIGTRWRSGASTAVATR